MNLEGGSRVSANFSLRRSSGALEAPLDVCAHVCVSASKASSSAALVAAFESERARGGRSLLAFLTKPADSPPGDSTLLQATMLLLDAKRNTRTDDFLSKNEAPSHGGE